MPKVRDDKWYIESMMAHATELTDLDIIYENAETIDEFIVNREEAIKKYKKDHSKIIKFSEISDDLEQYHFLVTHFSEIKNDLIDSLNCSGYEFRYNISYLIKLEMFSEKSLQFILNEVESINKSWLSKTKKSKKISDQFVKEVYETFYLKISLLDFFNELDDILKYMTSQEVDDLLVLRLQRESFKSIIETVGNTSFQLSSYPKSYLLLKSKALEIFNKTEETFVVKKDLLLLLDIIGEQIKKERKYEEIYHKLFLPSYTFYSVQEIDEIFSRYPQFMTYVDQKVLEQFIFSRENIEMITTRPLENMIFLISKMNFKVLVDYVQEKYLFELYKATEQIEYIIREHLKGVSFDDWKGKSIFDNSFLSLLNYLKEHKNDSLYFDAFEKFKQEIQSFITFDKENEEDMKIIEFFFWKVIKGYSLLHLIYFNTVEELKVEQRLGDVFIDIDPTLGSFIPAISAKNYLKLYRKYFLKFCPHLDFLLIQYHSQASYGRLLLIASLVFEEDKLDHILSDLNGNLRLLEQLFDGIDLSKIKKDSHGKVIYNRHLENLFVGADYNMFNECPFELSSTEKKYDDKLTPTLLIQKYFTYIVNFWTSLEKRIGKNNMSLPRIMNCLYMAMVLDNENSFMYPELLPYIFQIGKGNDVDHALERYYPVMRKRFYSSIPKVVGTSMNLSYEMLDLDDVYSLIVGKLTNCCFRMDGEAKTSMYHAMVSKDGRVFVVTKKNEVVAQSWVWRNGNVVCFDNIEFPQIYRENLEIQGEVMKCYQDASEEILKVSQNYEEIGHQIEFVTLGIHHVDEKIFEPFHLTKVANPVFPVNDLSTDFDTIYTDAKKQVILARKGDSQSFKQQSSNSKFYLEERKPIRTWKKDKMISLEDEKTLDFLTTINSTRISLGKSKLTIEEILESTYTKDWYIVITKDGNTHTGIFSFDSRAYQEFQEYTKNKQKILVHL